MSNALRVEIIALAGNEADALNARAIRENWAETKSAEQIQELKDESVRATEAKVYDLMKDRLKYSSRDASFKELAGIYARIEPDHPLRDLIDRNFRARSETNNAKRANLAIIISIVALAATAVGLYFSISALNRDDGGRGLEGASGLTKPMIKERSTAATD